MANEGDAERLVVLLEARIRDFEKSIVKASGTATQGYNRMQRGSRSATRQMEADMARSTGRINQALAATSTRMGSFARVSLGGLTAGFLAAVAPIMSVTAALNGAKAALESFDKIGNTARMLGVDVERLQELRFAAEQAGMAAENFDMGFRRMTRRAAEAAQGTGAAKEAFQELGIELTDQNGKLKDNHVLLGEVADALQKVPNHADKLRLAFKLFDTDGAKMLAVLEGGSAGLDEFARKAQDLGLVVDRHLVARAQELKSEFDTATKMMDMQFKQALIDLAPILVSSARLAADLAAAIRRIVDAFRELDQRSSAALGERLRELGADRVYHENEILRIQGEQKRMGGTNNAISEAFIAEHQTQLDAIEAEEKRILQILNDRRPPTPPLPVLDPEDDEETGSDNTSGGGRNAAAEAALRQAEAVRVLIENLKHEQDQLGRTSEDQELYNLLKQVGVERDSEFGQSIEATLRPLQAQREEIRRNLEMMEMLGDVGKTAVRGIIDALADGKIEAHEFGEILSNVLSMATNFFLNQAFNSFGSMFGGPGGFRFPGFASGTANTGGRRGEPRGIVHGQEAVIPLPNGGKVPVELGAQPAMAPQLTVIVNAPAGTEVADRRQSTDGSRIELTLRAMVRDEMRRTLPATMQGGFGIMPTVQRRS